MLNYIGQFFGEFGIPIHTRNFAKALLKYNPNINLTQLISDQGNIYQLDPILSDKFGGIDLSASNFIFFYPDYYNDWIFSPIQNIGYYIFEITKLPQMYVESINKLDHICSASQWAIQVLKDNGVTKPCHVIPGGVDISYFNPQNRNLDNNLFKILHIGKWEARKSSREIIIAFAKAFEHYDFVTLTISAHNIFTRKNIDQEVDKVLSEIGYSNIRNRIHVIGFIKDIRVLYNSHHLAIFAPKAEGIGLPIIESMACGVPTIAPCHSGLSEFINDGNAIVLRDGNIVDIYDENFFPDSGKYGSWVVPSIQEMVNKMLWAFNNYKKATDIGLSASTWIKNNYTWDIAAKKFLTTFNI